jgi:hypothetical protein
MMRHLIVMLTLLVPSLALAKQPTDRKDFPAEITADDALPKREMRPQPLRMESAPGELNNRHLRIQLLTDSPTPKR